MSVAVSKFITELSLHFPPKHPRPEMETAWIRSMADALRGYTPDVLQDAAKQIIATRKYTSFPLPAECKNACNAVLEYKQFLVRSTTLPELRDSDWSADRLRLAREICCSTDLGRQAAREGWVLSMRDFVRKHKRAPKDHEIAECKRTAKDFDDLYALCLRGQAGPFSASLAKLGEGMLAKREELAREALGR